MPQAVAKPKCVCAGIFCGNADRIEIPADDGRSQDPIGGIVYWGADALYAVAALGDLRSCIVCNRDAEQIEGLWKALGHRKIGVIYPDDAFGAAVLDGVKNAIKNKGSEPVAIASYPRQTAEADQAIKSVRSASPEAVVIVGPANTVGPILQKAHAQGWKPLFLTVSFVGTDDLILHAGADSEGMVVTQVVPPYYQTELKTVAMYRKTLAKL